MFGSKNIFVILVTLVFVESATAKTEMYRSWQSYSVYCVANGWESDDSGLKYTHDEKSEACGMPLSPHALGFATAAPGAGASVGFGIWGMRSNVVGSSYEFDIQFIASCNNHETGQGFVGTGNSSFDYRQVYEFSVALGPEMVIVDVPSYSCTRSGLSSGYDLTVSITANPSGVNWSRIDVPLTSSNAYPGTTYFTLPDGNYRLELSVGGNCGTLGGPYLGILSSFVATWTNTVQFSNLTPLSGYIWSNPIESRNFVNCRYCYNFEEIQKGTWIGATPSSELSFQMTGTSLFTGIMGFPPGYTNGFEVLVGQTSLGFFNGDQPVDFVSRFGSAVASFRVRNLTPIPEASTNTYPIMLNYDTSKADFLVLPTPGLQLLSGTNGQAKIFFSGVLEESTNLLDWVDVSNATFSPYQVAPSISLPSRFFRSRNP